MPVVMMTHLAQEKNIQLALAAIQEMPQIRDETVLIRVEGEDT